jgi:ankyrin repeat protein
MSQADIDAFVFSAAWGTLTSEGVTTAVVTRGIPVNGLHSWAGCTALHKSVAHKRHRLVVALLAFGADANVKSNSVGTSVWWAAQDSTARILQLLIDGGGSVNEPDNFGRTPLIALVSWNNGDAAARLGVLLARPELNLDVTYKGKTAEQWAEEKGHPDLAQAIAAERERRKRWSALRAAWLAAATFTPLNMI